MNSTEDGGIGFKGLFIHNKEVFPKVLHFKVDFYPSPADGSPYKGANLPFQGQQGSRKVDSKIQISIVAGF